MRNEIYQRRHDQGVLLWAANQLADMAELPSTWKWDDRIGMLAISLGIEQSFISAALFICGFVAVVLNFSTGMASAISVAGGFLVAAAFGFLFFGGPAIHLSGISVRRNRDLRPASRRRCCLRSVIAWAPWISFLSLFIYLLFHQINTDPSNLQNPLENSPLFLMFLLMSLILGAIILFGVLVAVVYPPRSVPDFLADTRLMRN